MSDFAVDVIVLDIDGGPMLEECLSSIAHQSVLPRSIIVFDNGSSDPVSGRMPRWENPPVVVVRSERNIGFAAGVNAAVRHASAELVALINNDVVLDSDWLETVTAAMEDGVAAAQTLIRRPDGLLDGGGITVADGTLRQIGHGMRVADGEVFGVSATAAIYRRELLQFDERYFAYYEDVELAARLRGAGWRMVVSPHVRATHRGSSSAARLGHRARFLRTRNRYFVARRHRGVGLIRALLAEDFRLLLRGRSSPAGIIAGLFSPGVRR